MMKTFIAYFLLFAQITRPCYILYQKKKHFLKSIFNFLNVKNKYMNFTPIYYIQDNSVFDKLVIFIIIRLANTEQMSELTVNYQKYLNQQLATILQMDIDNKQKIQLMEGFLCLLKQQQQRDKCKMKQNMSTSFSEAQSNFTAYEHQIQQLEDKILQKRVIKFQINQEIQGTEEDLFQIEKTVDTKREYDQKLRKNIQRKMQTVQREQSIHHEPQKSYLNKSIGAVSELFKGWLY